MQLLLISGQNHRVQTATALATAAHAADQGIKTLLVSVGPTHMLGQMIQQPLASHPRELLPHLAAMEMISIQEIAERWDGFLHGSRTSNIPARIRHINADELPIYPGIDTIALQLVAERAQEMFDLIVFDGPSTDMLMRDLTLSDSLRWMVRLIFGLDRGPGRSRKSQEHALLPSTIIPAELSGLSAVQNLRANMDNARGRLLDGRSGTRLRLVATADELPLSSLSQTMLGLGLYGLEIDTLVVCGDEQAISDADREKFAPWMLLDQISLLPADVAQWSDRGKQLYTKRSDGLGLPPLVDRASLSEQQRSLLLHIPFLDSKALDIAVANEEIVVQIHQFRRHIVLSGLAEGGNLRAKVEGHSLRLWVE